MTIALPRSRPEAPRHSRGRGRSWTALPLITVLGPVRIHLRHAWTRSAPGSIQAGVRLSRSTPSAGSGGFSYTGQRRHRDRASRARQPELVVPVGEPVHVTLTASDVIHSFYVPAFLVKCDAIPGPTTFDFTVDAPGIYRGQCAEFCGSVHDADGLHRPGRPARRLRGQWIAQQSQAAHAVDAHRGAGHRRRARPGARRSADEPPSRGQFPDPIPRAPARTSGTGSPRPITSASACCTSVTAFLFFLIGGLLADRHARRAGAARLQIRRRDHVQPAVLDARHADAAVLRDAGRRRLRQLPRAAPDRRSRTWPSRGSTRCPTGCSCSAA